VSLRFVPAAIALLLAVALGIAARGGTLHNGDEAVYGQFAQEMRDSGDWVTLRYEGHPVHQRPPLYVWVLAATRASRLPSVLFTALTALAVAALAGRLGSGDHARAVAAVVYAALALTWHYGRALESDPLFALIVVLAVERFLAGRPLELGGLVGLACMTKQVVGLLPLAAPAIAFLAGARPRRRDLLLAVTAFLAVWAPWHAIMTWRHGVAFWRGYLLHNVVERATSPLLGETSLFYYPVAVHRREGLLLALLLALAMVLGLSRAAATRRAPHVVAAILPLAALAVFTVARTRIEYYLLAILPFVAALAGSLVGPRTAFLSMVGVPVLAFLSHGAPDLDVLDPSRDVAALARKAGALAPPRLLAIGLQPSAPRFYSGRPTTRLVVDESERARWARVDVLDVPGVIELARDCTHPALVPENLALVKHGDPATERLAPCLGETIGEAPPYALMRAGTRPAPSSGR
jgi:4-amino-4-deoxy-L-arabinose transferase-like glycosyltransferase